jgi:putative restriction endonuclease
MTKQQLIEAISNLNTWKNGDQRAPHKPLLLIIALANIQQQKDRLILFGDLEKPLTELLVEFGPRRKTYYPDAPFSRLPRDGLWELKNSKGIIPIEGRSFTKTSLKKEEISGGFTKDVYSLLINNNNLIQEITNLILNLHFPQTIHQDILDAIGLDIDATYHDQEPQKIKRKRDPAFRGKILEAYSYRCAICGFDVRLGNVPIALEAAHIKWHQAGGPDIENNGLALCSLHHKLLDRGAIGLSKELKIMVSDKANGYIGFQEWLMNFDGKKLNVPNKEIYIPNIVFTEWHIREVFQGN